LPLSTALSHSHSLSLSSQLFVSNNNTQNNFQICIYSNLIEQYPFVSYWKFSIRIKHIVSTL
jgi:hypothetical protein